jgi:DNA-binding MarR family transcriptional regulator
MVHVKHSVGLRHLLDLFDSQKVWMTHEIAQLDLTPQMAKALMHVPETGTRTMSELADDLLCDASNCTGVVDRLESRGFVERTPSPTDRRAKCVMLTASGKRLRLKIEEAFAQTPPAIAALSAADQRTLREIIERALANAEALRIEGGGEHRP